KSGNTVTVDTSMGNAAGNETNGGGQGGTVVNLAAEPKVSGLKLSGPLKSQPFSLTRRGVFTGLLLPGWATGSR
ncbi:hypothetical protein, partial [Serratia fonticola]